MLRLVGLQQTNQTAPSFLWLSSVTRDASLSLAFHCIVSFSTFNCAINTDDVKLLLRKCDPQKFLFSVAGAMGGVLSALSERGKDREREHELLHC